MNDEQAHEFYADPANQIPAGPARRRSRRPLSSHVPIRFRPEVIVEVKELADEDRKTVSSWIRDLVEREVERRRPKRPRSEVEVKTVVDIDIEPQQATHTEGRAGNLQLI